MLFMITKSAGVRFRVSAGLGCDENVCVRTAAAAPLAVSLLADGGWIRHLTRMAQMSTRLYQRPAARRSVRRGI